MKGIILAGGKGTRLYPITISVSKQLLPIYDKPMIYYPLSVLMLSGINEILIITTPEDQGSYKKLLGNGEKLGLKIQYIEQCQPRGLAEAFILGEDFIGKDDVCLILGDNIFHGQGLTDILHKAKDKLNGAIIFGYKINDPKEYGIVEFNKQGDVISIEEKPEQPKSSYAVPGLYFYDNSVVKIAKEVVPSIRGELEITAINNTYLKMNKLKVEKIGRGIAWLDTGSPIGLLKAAIFVEAIQSRQGLYVSCIEEIAYMRGFINYEQLISLGQEQSMTAYGKYIMAIEKE